MGKSSANEDEGSTATVGPILTLDKLFVNEISTATPGNPINIPSTDLNLNTGTVLTPYINAVDLYVDNIYKNNFSQITFGDNVLMDVGKTMFAHTIRGSIPTPTVTIQSQSTSASLVISDSGATVTAPSMTAPSLTIPTGGTLKVDTVSGTAGQNLVLAPGSSANTITLNATSAVVPTGGTLFANTLQGNASQNISLRPGTSANTVTFTNATSVVVPSGGTLFANTLQGNSSSNLTVSPGSGASTVTLTGDVVMSAGKSITSDALSVTSMTVPTINGLRNVNPHIDGIDFNSPSAPLRFDMSLELTSPSLYINTNNIIGSSGNNLTLTATGTDFIAFDGYTRSYAVDTKYSATTFQSSVTQTYTNGNHTPVPLSIANAQFIKSADSFKCPRKGYYMISFTITASGGGTATVHAELYLKNGTEIQQYTEYTHGSGDGVTFAFGFLCGNPASDEFQIRLFPETGNLTNASLTFGRLMLCAEYAT